MKDSSAFQRTAFTLVELLVSISIIGVLMALLLPAVQNVREAMRLSACQNNMKQVGLGLQNYHSAHRTLPPAVAWSGPTGEPLGMGQVPPGLIDRIAMGMGEPGRMAANWLIMILPQLERSDLYSAYDFGVTVDHETNMVVRETFVDALMCPSDAFNGEYYVRDGANGAEENRYARGNMAINFGPDRTCIMNADADDVADCQSGVFVDKLPLESATTQLWGSGLGGVNKAFTFAAVTGGLSNVVIVDEIRAGPHQFDSRGVWALGFAGSSATSRHGLADSYSDAYGPNNQNPEADDVIGCAAIAAGGGLEGLISQRMPCWPGGQIANQATARSLHVVGVNVVRCDGSVEFINNSVDLEIWFNIHRRDAGRGATDEF